MNYWHKLGNFTNICIFRHLEQGPFFTHIRQIDGTEYEYHTLTFRIKSSLMWYILGHLRCYSDSSVKSFYFVFSPVILHVMLMFIFLGQFLGPERNIKLSDTENKSRSFSTFY